jgi:AAA15 family ATPase/GTPase
LYKNITLKRFRGISEMTLTDFRRVNLIVGKNNSGKSTALESLFLLSNPADPSLFVRVSQFRNVDMEETTWNVLFHQLNTKIPIQLEGDIQVGAFEEKRKLVARPLTTKMNSIEITKNIEKSTQKDIVRDEFEAMAKNIEIEFTYKRSTGELETIASELIDMGDNYQINRSVPDFEEPMFCRYIRQGKFGDLGKHFHQIKIRKQSDRIVSVLKYIEPDLREISLGDKGELYCDVGLDRFVPIRVMGDGFIKLLAVILGIYEMQSGVLLIDEIENGFHHTSLKILWDAIFKATEEFNVQVFATTHSLECVKAFGTSYKDYMQKHNQDLVSADSIRLYRMEKQKERSRVISYDTKLLLSSLERDWEMR